MILFVQKIISILVKALLVDAYLLLQRFTDYHLFMGGSILNELFECCLLTRA